MGSTAQGRDWCIKALHPSDPIQEVQGIPDQSSLPSVFLNFQTVATITPRANATGTWSWEATLLPHPVNFLYSSMTDSVGNLQTNIMNTQLSGATHLLKYDDFRAMAQRWRLAYAGVTIYQDGPDLANQGTICVAQTAMEPHVYYAGFVDPSFNSEAGSNVRAMPRIEMYNAEDYPNYTVSQSMPNAYFNQSKFGAYVPLKLTNTHQKWVSDKDSVLCSDGAQAPLNANTLILPTTTAMSNFPHVNVTRTFALVPHNHAGGAYSNAFSLGGHETSPMCNGTVAHITCRNMAVTTSLSLFFRFGFEINVSPGTTLSPQQHLSPHYDPRAIEAYFAISRELKDAYPADYNDLGKIWDVIKAGLSAAKPYLSMIPGIGPIAPGLASGIIAVGDAVRGASTSSRSSELENRAPVAQRDPPSMGDIERIRANRTAQNTSALQRKLGKMGAKSKKRRSF